MHSRAQTTDKKWLWPLRIWLIVPALLVILAAEPRLISGLAQEAAFPAQPYMQMNVRLTPEFYKSAAQILSHTPASDGDAQLWRAEALLKDGHARKAARIAQAALARTPASARGWIVLAQALEGSEPEKAASALELSLELGPREYFLIPPRLEAGAVLWRYLPLSAQNKLLEDTRWLIANEDLRPSLHELLAVKGGAALVTLALAGHPDELRALNRRLTRDRLGLH